MSAPRRLGHGPVITMVARFAPGKGHDLFLATALRLLQSGFPGTFVLAGEGPLLADCRRRYAHDRMLFLGYRDDVPSLLAGSQASVICSESEAFPYAALESLAQGTPVIATDCGGLAEAVQPGFNGHLFPIGDSGSLARLLGAVAEDRSGFGSRTEIAGACRDRFSHQSMVDATVAVYRDVCHKA